MNDQVLVVAHEGYRNGATRVLVNVLPTLVAELGVPVHVEVRVGGPLAEALRSMATGHGRVDGAPAAVLVNSSLAADALWQLPEGTPSVVYVHEEGEALRSLSPPQRTALIERADRVACVSTGARDDLTALGVDPGRLAIVAPPVSVRPVGPGEAEAVGTALRSGRRHLVVGCGEASWRKGTDLFVALASQLAGGDVQMAWIGRRSRGFARVLDHDVELVAPGGVTWVGEVEEPGAHLAAADLLVMTSREDPQPLVPLEAAGVGTATVGFGGTGLDDFVAAGAACSVPYPDVSALASAVHGLLADPAACDGLVERARNDVLAHRTVDAAARALLAELRTVARSIRSGPSPLDPGGRT